MKKTDTTKEVIGIPNWFANPLMLEKGGGCCDKYEEEFQGWFTGCKFQKRQKIRIKNDLLLIAWHPSR